MATYKYQAVAADGTVIRDVAEGVSVSSVENDLMRRGLTVKNVREKKGFAAIEITKAKVPKTEIMHFSRQLAAFVRAGIPIVDAVRVVEEGTSNARFRGILADITELIQAGVPFSQAVATHADVFPPYYLGILRSAEMTGQLDVVLDQLAVYIERDLDARSKVKSALTYPAVIMGMSVITVIVMAVFVLPKFVTFFDELNSKLPLPTRMLLGFSEFTSNWWWAIILVIAAFIATVVISGRTEGGLTFRHKLFLKMPLIGVIVRNACIERFCRIIAAMMRAGVPLPEAMSSAIESTNNRVFQKALNTAREQMLQGEGIARPIDETGLFPSAACQMIRVGEETGTLDVQVEAAGEFYARELEWKLKRLTSLFEPAVILLMGFIVGFVAVALISAMYGVFQGQNAQAQ